MILSNNIRHYIGGNDFGEPRNWTGLQINIDWLQSNEGVNINLNDLEFVHKANKYLQERIMNGLNGGVGVFEGEPYKIIVGPENEPIYTFNGYLDFTEDSTILGNEELKCSLKKVKGEDWLNDTAYGYSLGYLDSIGFINQKDKLKIPYVINYVPDGMQLIILSMSVYMMTKELIENIQKLAETIADVTNASTPVIGVSVGLGAGVVTAWDLGDFIMVTLKTLARLAYIVAIVIAIKELIDQIFEQLLPKKRYHLGMSLKSMMETYCRFFNLNLQSSLLNEFSDYVLIPQKSVKGGDSEERAYPDSTSEIGTFGGLITSLKTMFNADYRIVGNNFIFERSDYFKQIGNYVLPDVLTDQNRLLNSFSLNTNEMIGNYNIYFQIDMQDQNTFDSSKGRVFMAKTSPIKTINKDLVSIKNLAEISLPFSLGKCKNSLTDVEKMAKSLGKVVDNLTGVFGKGTNYQSKIENRIGSLLLSSHFTSYGKLISFKGQTLTSDQKSRINAKLLWDKFHFINSFAETNGTHNQYFKYKDVTVPMSLNDFGKLAENNYGIDANGNEIMIESVSYEPDSRKAVVSFRMKKKYTNNLKLEYVY